MPHGEVKEQKRKEGPPSGSQAASMLSGKAPEAPNDLSAEGRSSAPAAFAARMLSSKVRLGAPII